LAYTVHVHVARSASWIFVIFGYIILDLNGTTCLFCIPYLFSFIQLLNFISVRSEILYPKLPEQIGKN